MSKSTQWDLYRVINIPQLSGLPLPCSKSSYHSLAVSDTPGYYVLLFPRLNSLLLFVGKKEKFSFAWTLAHLLIKLILVSMFTWGSELSDRWLKERISSEQGIALLKSRGNVVILIPFQHSVVTTGSVLVSFMLSQLHTWPNQVSVEGSRMYPVPGCPRVCSNIPTVFSEMRKKLCVLIIPRAKHKV